VRGLAGKTAIVTGAGAIDGVRVNGNAPGMTITVDGGTLADHARSWIAGQAARAGIIVGLEPART
jgi:hypothetical protein